MRLVRLLGRGALLLMLVGVAVGAQQAPPPAPRVVWFDVNGSPLPFATDEELLDFLATANVVEQKEISNGVTVPLKLTLEKNGVRAHAVFRRLDQESRSMEFTAGEREMFFRDSYIFEPAAYELSRMLGMDNVPPAILRKVNGTSGSVQIWVEKAQTEERRVKSKAAPPDPRRWAQQAQVMNLFDALIYNTDRTRNNLLITGDWKVWLIDHTRAFRRHVKLPDENRIQGCDRELNRRLRALDEGAVRERLKTLLRPIEITTIMKRRDLIVHRLDKLIAERGEDAVLFTAARD